MELLWMLFGRCLMEIRKTYIKWQNSSISWIQPRIVTWYNDIRIDWLHWAGIEIPLIIDTGLKRYYIELVIKSKFCLTISRIPATPKTNFDHGWWPKKLFSSSPPFDCYRRRESKLKYWISGRTKPISAISSFGVHIWEPPSRRQIPIRGECENTVGIEKEDKLVVLMLFLTENSVNLP